MSFAIHRTRRGLTLMELMLALLITTMVATAISGMMGAITAGVTTRRDNRSTMVGAAAAATRLSAYVAPSRCVLDRTGANLVLWLSDSRESDTVHATEVRWLKYDAASGAYSVHFVSFPENWAQAAKDLEDNEYPLGSNWSNVLTTYKSKNLTTSLPLVDRLTGVDIATDAISALDARHLNFTLSFETGNGAVDVCVAATIRSHATPSS